MIRYVHSGGPVRFTLLWARDHDALAPVPRGRCVRARSAACARLVARAALDRALALSEWVWVGLLVLAAASLARAGLVRVRRGLVRTSAWPSLRWILAASLDPEPRRHLVGPARQLGGDRAEAAYILDALSQSFLARLVRRLPAGALLPAVRGLEPAASPVVAGPHHLRRHRGLHPAGRHLAPRQRRDGRRHRGRRLRLRHACVRTTRRTDRGGDRRGHRAVRLLREDGERRRAVSVLVGAVDGVLPAAARDRARGATTWSFAAAATLSVCTKDQAYGLYLLPPFVIVEQIWRVKRRAGAAARVAGARSSIDASSPPRSPRWRCSRSARTCCSTTAASWTTCGSSPALAAPPIASTSRRSPGHLELLRETIRLIEISMGWPLFVAGVDRDWRSRPPTPRRRRMTIWLLVPVVSYYLGFINVILYNYDRFVLPMCFVLAIFGGLAFDRLLSSDALRRWGRAALAGAFAYTLLYAGTVDVLMMRDSRYDVEAVDERARRAQRHRGRQRAARVPAAARRIPARGHQHDRGAAPGASALTWCSTPTTPARCRAETAWGQMIAGLERGELGYRLVGRFRRDVAVAVAAGRAPGSGRTAPGDARLQHAAQHQPDDRDLPARTLTTARSSSAPARPTARPSW